MCVQVTPGSSFQSLISVSHPLKSCSSILSPKTLRNSAKAGVSSLLPNSSSSDVWCEETITMGNWKNSVKVYKMKKTTQDDSHLTKLLIDDSKLESVVHFVLIKTDDQLRGLGWEKTETEQKRPEGVNMCVSAFP